MSEVNPPTTQHALDACERVLRPLVRLALECGLKYQEIDAVIRALMIDEATRDHQQRTGKSPSGSQLSVTTGINRKEVKRLTEQVDPAEYKPAAQSLAAVIFTAWRSRAEADANCAVLPIASSDPQVFTFEQLASTTVKDVHPRSLLDELIRLRLVEKQNDQVRLTATRFIPPGTSAEMMELISENVRTHLSAAVSNTINQQRPFLEQSAVVTEIAFSDCAVLHATARLQWGKTYKQLTTDMVALPTTQTNPHQMRIGMYAYFEPMPSIKEQQ
jgi:hypothetical protein